MYRKSNRIICFAAKHKLLNEEIKSKIKAFIDFNLYLVSCRRPCCRCSMRQVVFVSLSKFACLLQSLSLHISVHPDSLNRQEQISGLHTQTVVPVLHLWQDSSLSSQWKVYSGRHGSYHFL